MNLLRHLERKYCVNNDRREVSQAYFRVVIFLICGFYCYSIKNTPYLRAITAFAFVATVFWIFMAWRSVGSARARHIGALIYDCLIIGLVMVGFGSRFMGLFAVLLWVSIGYGIRYRNPLYLKLGMIFTSVTFVVSALVTEWSDWGIFLSLLVTLIVVPLVEIGPMTRMINLLEQLDAANKELDEANKIKTRFISNVSHDLLTPLSSIIGYCGLSPPSIDGIRINAYQLTRQIRAILGQSVAEDLSYDEHHEAFEPLELIKQVAAIGKPLAESRDIRISVIATEPLGTFSGPVHALSICLINLVNNAARHSGGTLISLDVMREGTTIAFVVSDNGHGIPAEQQQLVFNRFHRVSPTTSTEGLGLGLSIVKDTIEKVSGTVHLTSSPAGSSFKLTVPAVSCPHQRQAAPAAPEYTPAHGPVVLFVDDEFQSRNAWTSVLREVGYHVHAATGGAEALAAMDAGNTYGMCILDYRMPEMDGITLAEAIKERNPNARIIMISADIRDGIATFKDAVAQGVIDHALSKPLHPGLLISTVQQALAQPGRVAVAPTSLTSLA